MKLVLSAFLYGVIGVALAAGGITVLGETALFCTIMVCVVLVDVIAFTDGMSRN
jgi:hypothetical protein